MIRLSVALFVLRLIPSYKTAQRRITYGVILVNFAISAYANIVYGLSCRPLKSNWTEVPDAKCMSPRTLVITSQINAGETLSAFTGTCQSSKLTEHSSFLRLRHCNSTASAIPTLESRNVEENEDAAKLHLLPWSDHSRIEYRTGRHND